MKLIVLSLMFAILVSFLCYSSPCMEDKVRQNLREARKLSNHVASLEEGNYSELEKCRLKFNILKIKTEELKTQISNKKVNKIITNSLNTTLQLLTNIERQI